MTIAMSILLPLLVMVVDVIAVIGNHYRYGRKGIREGK
jgi:hypothetical protein